MNLFLLVFFLLYSGLHLYAFLKARATLAFGTLTSVFIIVFMLAMIAAPMIIHYLEKIGLESYARFMAYIGYTWLGILFLFCSWSFAIDIYRLIVYSGGLMLHRDFSNLIPSPRLSFVMPLLLSIVIAIYGYFEARDICTEKIVIKTPKISRETGIIRIAQISDIHLGLLVREEKLKKILTEVKLLNPDILVSTGDLVDGQICKLESLERLFKEINPRYGKFAITGNHEFYAGFETAQCFIEDSGFKLLRGDAVTVADAINIAGIDDPAGKTLGISKNISEKELLSKLPREKFTLFLKHRPIIDKSSLGLFDLQLSGHNHKGQIFPFSIITWLYYPVNSGLARLPNNSYLYVNRGAGTWGPPIRFLSPPEVTLIELIHGD